MSLFFKGRLMMEMKGLKQQDLIPILGSKGNVSKILSGKAKLQLEDIHPLSALLGIPADALIPKQGHQYAIGSPASRLFITNKKNMLSVDCIYAVAELRLVSCRIRMRVAGRTTAQG